MLNNFICFWIFFLGLVFGFFIKDIMFINPILLSIDLIAIMLILLILKRIGENNE